MNNRATEYGGGIYYAAGRLLVSGKVVVKDNFVVNGTGNNIYLSNDSLFIEIAGALTDDEVSGEETGDEDPDDDETEEGETKDEPILYVTLRNGTGVVTSGLNGHGTADQFAPDNERYVVVENSDGEAEICEKATITFEAGDENAVGSMEAVELAADSEYILPDCDFEVLRKTFAGWAVKIGDAEAVTKAEGDPITVTADTLVTAQWKSNDPVKVKGVTGSFDDKIKLNFYLIIPDALLADKDAYVVLFNENTAYSVTLPIAEAEFVKDKGHKFSMPLAAKESGDIIDAYVYDGEDHLVTLLGNSGTDYTEYGLPYTLDQYFIWLGSNGTTDEKKVGAAAKDYCSAARVYFKYNANGASVSSAVEAVQTSDLNGYISGRSGKLPDGVSIKGISAMLEADNTLRLYYKFEGVEPGDFTYSIDGEDASIIERSDGAYYLAMNTGVYSNHLHKTHTYTISDGTNSYTITASVLTYARSCLTKKNAKEADKDLGKALYLYNKAAVNAFGE